MPYTNPFPSHDKYLLEFHTDLKAATTKVLGFLAKKSKSPESLISKLHLLARLKQELNVDITTFINHLNKTEKKEKILKSLSELYLENPEHVIVFLDYFKKINLITHNDKKDLYLLLYRCHIAQHDEDRERGMVFLNKLLQLSDIHPALRIEANAYLSIDYLALDYYQNKEISKKHLSQAVKLEEKEVAKNTSPSFSVEKYCLYYIESWINQPELELLSLHFLLVLTQVYASNSNILFIIRGHLLEKLQQFTTNPEIYRVLIQMTRKIGSLQKPLDDYLQRLYTQPDTIISKYEKVMIALETDDTDKAIAFIPSSASDALSLYLLGIAHWQKLQEKTAVKLFSSAVVENRLSKQLLSSQLSHLFEIQIESLIGIKSYVNAIKVSNQALQLFPQSYTFLEGRFIAYKSLDNKPQLKLQSVAFSEDEKKSKSDIITLEKKLSSEFCTSKKADPDPADEIMDLIRRAAYDKAKKSIKALQHKYPQLHLNHYLLSTLYSHQGDFTQSHEHLKKALEELDTDYLAPQLILSQYCIQQYAQAITTAQSILQNWDQEFAYGRLARQLALTVLAHLYYLTQDIKSGIELFHTYIHNPQFSPDEKISIHLSLALFYYFLEAFDSSIEHALQAISGISTSTNDQSYLILAMSYFQQNQITLAIQALEKRAHAFPNKASVHIDLGYSYFVAGEDEKAIASIQKALALSPLKVNQLQLYFPASLIDKVFEPTTSLSVVTETEKSTLIAEENRQEEKNNHFVMNTGLSSVKQYLSHEQLLHRVFQIDKKRRYDMELSLTNNARIIDWHVSGAGIIKIDHEKVTNIRFSQYTNTQSNLYAFFNKAKLNQPCDDDLIAESEKIILRGVIVGKKGKQGIRILNQEETTHAANRYHLPAGYNTKLKFEAEKFHDIRIFGHAVISHTDHKYKLFVYDTIIRKAHSSR